MASLSWGKPKIRLVKLDEGDTVPETPTWIVVPTPVKDSTKLSTTEGETREAPLEGGGFEDSAQGKNTYLFEFEIYAKAGREKPVEDIDGVIDGHYKIEMQPEDPLVEGRVIDVCTLHCTETFDAAIGDKWKYTAKPLQPSDGASSVKREVVTFA